MQYSINTDFNLVVLNAFKGQEKLLQNLTENHIHVLVDFAKEIENKKHFLKFRKQITLGPCSIVEHISQLKDVFPEGGVDDDFVNWGLNEEQVSSTESFPIDISEMKPGQDGMLSQIFDGDDESIWIPQNRILQIILEHEDELLKTGYANLLPVKKKDGTRFVVDVSFRSGRLSVRVFKFEDSSVYRGVGLHRVFTSAVL